MPLSPLDQSELEAIRKVIDPSDFAALIKVFRDEIERSQLELRGADSTTAVERICHRLIGVSAPIGLRSLAEKARDTQCIARNLSSEPVQAVPLRELENALTLAVEALDNVLG